MVKRVNKFMSVVALLLAATSCQEETPKVYWEKLSVVRNSGGVEADIVYPYRFGGDEEVSTKMNNLINEAIIFPIFNDMNASVAGVSIDSMLNRVVIEKQMDSVLTRIPYKFITTGSVYTAEKFTSVLITNYGYVGGANGNSNDLFLNFDNSTGDIIDIVDLIEFDDNLLAELRKQFCAKCDVSINATAKQAGLFITPADLDYPEQIGFTKDGVLFYYNLYEVGPRSFGKLEVVIPYDRVKLK